MCRDGHEIMYVVLVSFSIITENKFKVNKKMHLQVWQLVTVSLPYQTSMIEFICDNS